MFKEVVNISLPVLVYTEILNKSLYYLKIFWLIYSNTIVICIEIASRIRISMASVWKDRLSLAIMEKV